MEKEKLTYYILSLLTLWILLPSSVMATKPVIRFTRGDAPNKVKERISRNMNSFMSSLSNSKKSENSVANHSNGGNTYKLLESNTIICDDLDSLYDCNKTKNGYEVRGLKVKQKFNDSTYIDKQLTIGISSEGEIASVSFSINDRLYDNLFSRDYVALIQNSNDSIINEAGMLALEDKKAIVDFVEQYQTSCANRDMDFLNNLFSEDAIIVTGSNIHRYDSNTNYSKPLISYTKRSKSDHLSVLQKTLGRKDPVDMQITDIDIKQHPMNKEIYGVTIVQQWKVGRFSDNQTLFLIIDTHSDFRILVKQFVPKGEHLDLYDFAVP